MKTQKGVLTLSTRMPYCNNFNYVLKYRCSDLGNGAVCFSKPSLAQINIYARTAPFMWTYVPPKSEQRRQSMKGAFCMDTIEIRFFEKVNRAGSSDCWNWIGAIASSGYGVFTENGKYTLAHRYSFAHSNGPIPEGLCVLHKCDNRRCVNPKHLFIGTKRDNILDAMSKGRANPVPPKTQSGEKHPSHKLTDENVRQIRERYAQGGITQRKLAKMYSVRQSTIWEIVTKRGWK